jgi:hypothetical protein
MLDEGAMVKAEKIARQNTPRCLRACIAKQASVLAHPVAMSPALAATAGKAKPIRKLQVADYASLNREPQDAKTEIRWL